MTKNRLYLRRRHAPGDPGSDTWHGRSQIVYYIIRLDRAILGRLAPVSREHQTRGCANPLTEFDVTGSIPDDKALASGAEICSVGLIN